MKNIKQPASWEIEIFETGNEGEFLVFVPSGHPASKKLFKITSPSGVYRRKKAVAGHQWVLTEHLIRLLGLVV